MADSVAAKRRKREAKCREVEQWWQSTKEDADGNPSAAQIADMQAKIDEINAMDAEIKGVSSVEDWLEMQSVPVSDRLDTGPMHDPEPAKMSEDERVFRFGTFLQAATKRTRGTATQRDVQVLYDTAGKRAQREGEQFYAAATGANEENPADGGFLVGEDTTNEMLRRMYATGVLGTQCRRRSISRDSNSVSFPGIDETSRADGSRHGGVRGYWVAEGGSFTASRPAYRRITLTLNKLTALYYATDELLEDASLLGQVVEEAMTEELGFKLDDAIWNGDGSGKPKGVTNADALVSVTASGTVSSYDASDIIGAFARVYAPSMSRGEWYANQDVIPNLHTMVLSVGSTIVPIYQPMQQFGGNFAQSPFSQQLYNRPLNFIEQAAANGSDKNLTFADLGQYLLVDKGGIRRASSIHVSFTNDETVFRWIYRVDGQPMWHSALTPFKGSATQSPFVTLVT